MVHDTGARRKRSCNAVLSVFEVAFNIGTGLNSALLLTKVFPFIKENPIEKNKVNITTKTKDYSRLMLCEVLICSLSWVCRA